MQDIILEGLAPGLEEGTIQNWFVEEGDPVEEGDDLVEISAGEGTFVIQAPASGIVAEVCYDEGESVAKGEVLCTIDVEDSAVDEIDDDEDDDEENDKE